MGRKLHLRPWGSVAILSLCFVMSYVDRQILGLLVQPIKTSLGASDIQIGLLFGATFGVVFAIAGIPIGAIADRWNRKRLVTIGVTLWSVLTIAAGFAVTLPFLFFCRFGVAIGEATLSPAATSMISDLFSPKRRALPISILFASAMLGAAGAFLIGAAVVAAVTSLLASGVAPGWAKPWQLTFVAVGLPGLVFALVILLFMREPARTEADLADRRPPIREIMSLFSGRWWGLGPFFFAMALSQLAPASIAAWVPTILQREHGYSSAEAGLALGLTQLLTAPAGQVILGATANLLFRRLQRGLAFVLVCAVSIAISTAAFLLLPGVRDPNVKLVLFGITLFFSFGMCSIPPIAIGLLLPNRMRGSSIATYYLMMALLGVGLGPVLVPWLAAQLPSGPDSLTRAMAAAGGLSGLVALPVCAVAMFGLRRRETLTHQDTGFAELRAPGPLPAPTLAGGESHASSSLWPTMKF